jgi:prepilin-type N-terminal cleavage/methylation domain-containing protein
MIGDKRGFSLLELLIVMFAITIPVRFPSPSTTMSSRARARQGSGRHANWPGGRRLPRRIWVKCPRAGRTEYRPNEYQRPGGRPCVTADAIPPAGWTTFTPRGRGYTITATATARRSSVLTWLQRPPIIRAKARRWRRRSAAHPSVWTKGRCAHRGTSASEGR